MKIFFACENHIDDAIDDLVDEHETFPVVNECITEKCKYCSNKSKYKVEINS